MKKMRILAALVTAVAMIGSAVTAFAAPPAPSNLQGTTVVQNPIYAVLLPAAPVVTLNPLQIAGQPQVSSPWYVIANRSNVPVRVLAQFGTHSGLPATATPAVTWQTTAAGITHTEVARDVFLQLQWARPGATLSGLTGASNAAALTATAVGWTATDVVDGLVAINTALDVTAATGGAPLSATGGRGFALYLTGQQLNDAPAITVDNSAALTANQVAAFRFSGEVNRNPNVTWPNNVASARVIFTIAPVLPTAIAGIHSDGTGATLAVGNSAGQYNHLSTVHPGLFAIRP